MRSWSAHPLLTCVRHDTRSGSWKIRYIVRLLKQALRPWLVVWPGLWRSCPPRTIV